MAKQELNIHYLALDLKDDPKLIERYKKYHQEVWPEVNQNLRAAGIKSAEIFLTGNRLVMRLEVDEAFSFEKMAKMNEKNHKVKQWEALMWDFQQALPHAAPGEKWILMDKIYDLNEQLG